MKPRLIVEQKLTAFVNKYSIYRCRDDGSKDKLVAFAQQKRFAFKEKIIFYTNEEKNQVAFSFRAEKVLDVHGRYFVENPEGKTVGMFKKDFKQSLLNSTWNILDSSGVPKLVIAESSQALALLRRFVGFVPFIGSLGEIITIFFRYHFEFKSVSSNQVVGTYKKTKQIRDHYEFSMTDGAFDQEDWRVLASVAVALDALQSR